jgi:hypothetical protein
MKKLILLMIASTALGEDYHVEEGNATLTIIEWSRQSSIQVMFDYNIVKHYYTRAIYGEYTPIEALTAILQYTDLKIEPINKVTYAVTLTGDMTEDYKIVWDSTSPHAQQAGFCLPSSCSYRYYCRRDWYTETLGDITLRHYTEYERCSLLEVP